MEEWHQSEALEEPVESSGDFSDDLSDPVPVSKTAANPVRFDRGNAADCAETGDGEATATILHNGEFITLEAGIDFPDKWACDDNGKVTAPDGKTFHWKDDYDEIWDHHPDEYDQSLAPIIETPQAEEAFDIDWESMEDLYAHDEADESGYATE